MSRSRSVHSERERSVEFRPSRVNLQQPVINPYQPAASPAAGADVSGALQDHGQMEMENFTDIVADPFQAPACCAPVGDDSNGGVVPLKLTARATMQTQANGFAYAVFFDTASSDFTAMKVTNGTGTAFSVDGLSTVTGAESGRTFTTSPYTIAQFGCVAAGGPPGAYRRSVSAACRVRNITTVNNRAGVMWVCDADLEDLGNLTLANLEGLIAAGKAKAVDINGEINLAHFTVTNEDLHTWSGSHFPFTNFTGATSAGVGIFAPNNFCKRVLIYQGTAGVVDTFEVEYVQNVVVTTIFDAPAISVFARRGALYHPHVNNVHSIHREAIRSVPLTSVHKLVSHTKGSLKSMFGGGIRWIGRQVKAGAHILAGGAAQALKKAVLEAAPALLSGAIL